MPFVKENIFTYRTVYDKQNKLLGNFTLTLRFWRKINVSPHFESKAVVHQTTVVNMYFVFLLEFELLKLLQRDFRKSLDNDKVLVYNL